VLRSVPLAAVTPFASQEPYFRACYRARKQGSQEDAVELSNLGRGCSETVPNRWQSSLKDEAYIRKLREHLFETMGQGSARKWHDIDTHGIAAWCCSRDMRP
jgi:hypothetical protein